MGELPARKRNRLENFDYSSPCVALLTICAEKRRPIFGEVDGSLLPPTTRLSALGELVQQSICEIEKRYSSVKVDTYSILPDHVHLLLRLEPTDRDPPAISRIVRLFKAAVTRAAGRPVWQKGFHDHIIRTEEDYQNAWNYVAYNAAKWVEVGKATIDGTGSAGTRGGPASAGAR